MMRGVDGRTNTASLGPRHYPNEYISVKSSGEITKHYFVSGQRVSATVNVANAPAVTDRNSWMHGNHQGATQYITDKDAKVVEHLESLPFGESWIEQRSASDAPARQVTGLQHDRETGLVYGGARYFDPRARAHP